MKTARGGETRLSPCYTQSMSFLTNMLKLLLIACTLGYTNAWAFETVMQHGSDVAEAGASSEVSLIKLLPDNDDISSHGCDHCCHASAHILALDSGCLSQHIVLSNSIITVLDVTAVSHIALPDSPPPKFLL